MLPKSMLLYHEKMGLEIYLASKLCKKTYKEIGKFYGKSEQAIYHIMQRVICDMIKVMELTGKNYTQCIDWLIEYYKPDMNKFNVNFEYTWKTFKLMYS